MAFYEPGFPNIVIHESGHYLYISTPYLMKRSDYLLKIDDPCAESWAAMLPTDSGRFCTNCAKNVIDFTKLTDDQVLAVITKPGENICGRFEASQVNRYLANSTEYPNRSHLYKFFAGLFLLTAADRALAKTGIDNGAPMGQGYDLISQPKEFSASEPKRNPADSLDRVFRGRVIHALDQTPISGVSIRLEDADVQTVTNREGAFELSVPSNLLKKKNAFVVSFIGYETKTVTVSTHDFKNERSIVLSDDPQLNEVVYVGNYSVHNRKWWQFWKKKECKH